MNEPTTTTRRPISHFVGDLADLAERAEADGYPRLVALLMAARAEVLADVAGYSTTMPARIAAGRARVEALRTAAGAERQG